MSYSFEKGFKQVPNGKSAQVKKELMEALSITSRPGWLSRLRGKIEPKVSEAKKIEEIFSRHGIKQVWGD